MPVVPTAWVGPCDIWTSGSDAEIVVKPSISGGGRLTARYGAEERAEAEAHVRALQSVGQTAMVQDYISSVDTEGELSTIFVAGAFSHAVRKGPLLERGAGILDSPWEHDTSWGLATPTAAQLDIAQATVQAVERRLGQSMTYARVDLVDAPTGDPLVLEVELIDPSLSLTLHPNAATDLASAVARGLERR